MARMASKLVAVILGVVIAGVLLGTVFPIGLNQVNEDNTYNVTLENNTETTIQANLNATLTGAGESTTDTATIKLEDTEDGSTESNTIDNGTTVSYTTLTGGTVNVTLNNVDTTVSPDIAEVTMDVPKDFAWDSGSKSIYSVFGIFLIIVPLIVLAKQALKA